MSKIANLYVYVFIFFYCAKRKCQNSNWIRDRARYAVILGVLPKMARKCIKMEIMWLPHCQNEEEKNSTDRKTKISLLPQFERNVTKTRDVYNTKWNMNDYMLDMYAVHTYIVIVADFRRNPWCGIFVSLLLFIYFMFDFYWHPTSRSVLHSVCNRNLPKKTYNSFLSLSKKINTLRDHNFKEKRLLFFTFVAYVWYLSRSG